MFMALGLAGKAPAPVESSRDLINSGALFLPLGLAGKAPAPVESPRDLIDGGPLRDHVLLG